MFLETFINVSMLFYIFYRVLHMPVSTPLHDSKDHYREVAKRLRQFAKETFGSVSGLCRAIDRQETYFIRVLAGEYMPGSKMQSLLREVGCDIEWLITGKAAVISETLAEKIEDRIVEDGPTIEDFNTLSLELARALRKVEDLKQRLSDLNRKFENNDDTDSD